MPYIQYSSSAGKKLWDILKKGGYPLEITIPLKIDTTAFDSVLTKIMLRTDLPWNILLAWNETAGQLSSVDRSPMDIMAAVLRFMAHLLNKANWSLPSEPKLRKYLRLYLYSGILPMWYEANTNYSPAVRKRFQYSHGNTSRGPIHAYCTYTGSARFDEESRKFLSITSRNPEQGKDENMLADWKNWKRPSSDSFGRKEVVTLGNSACCQ